MTKECFRGALDPDKCPLALGPPSGSPRAASARSVSNHFERLFGSSERPILHLLVFRNIHSFVGSTLGRFSVQNWPKFGPKIDPKIGLKLYRGSNTLYICIFVYLYIYTFVHLSVCIFVFQSHQDLQSHGISSPRWPSMPQHHDHGGHTNKNWCHNTRHRRLCSTQRTTAKGTGCVRFQRGEASIPPTKDNTTNEPVQHHTTTNDANECRILRTNTRAHLFHAPTKFCETFFLKNQLKSTQEVFQTNSPKTSCGRERLIFRLSRNKRPPDGEPRSRKPSAGNDILFVRHFTPFSIAFVESCFSMWY